MKRKVLVLAAILLLPLLTAAAPPHVMVNGYRVQVRGLHTHPLYGCESRPVTHTHAEVFLITKGRGQYMMELHVGTYRFGGRLCWVAYQSVPPAMCANSCRSGRGNNLRGVVEVTVRSFIRASKLVIGPALLLVLIREIVLRVAYVLI